MKNRKYSLAPIKITHTSHHQERAISRRGILLGMMGLAVASCGTPNVSTGASSLASQTFTPTTSTPTAVSALLSQPSIPAVSASVGQMPLTFKGHSGNVQSVAWSPDGKRIASGGDERTATYSGASHIKALRILLPCASLRPARASWYSISFPIIPSSRRCNRKRAKRSGRIRFQATPIPCFWHLVTRYI